MTENKIKVIKPDMIQTDLLMAECAMYAHKTDVETMQLLNLARILKDVAREEDYYGVLFTTTESIYMPVLEAVHRLSVKVQEIECSAADMEEIVKDMTDAKDIKMTDILTVLFSHFDLLHEEGLFCNLVLAIRGWYDDVMQELDDLKIEAASEAMELTPIDDDDK